MNDSSALAWRTSSHSDGSGVCVEVADLPGGGRGVRDSKNPDGGHLTVSPVEWAAFVTGVQAGEFD